MFKCYWFNTRDFPPVALQITRHSVHTTTPGSMKQLKKSENNLKSNNSLKKIINTVLQGLFWFFFGLSLFLFVYQFRRLKTHTLHPFHCGKWLLWENFWKKSCAIHNKKKLYTCSRFLKPQQMGKKKKKRVIAITLSCFLCFFCVTDAI
jgi:hypothetical protein